MSFLCCVKACTLIRAKPPSTYVSATYLSTHVSDPIPASIFGPPSLPIIDIRMCHSLGGGGGGGSNWWNFTVALYKLLSIIMRFKNHNEI